jgi:hypothetical protein
MLSRVIIWDEAVVVWLKIPWPHLPGESDENHDNLSQAQIRRERIPFTSPEDYRYISLHYNIRRAMTMRT